MIVAEFLPIRSMEIPDWDKIRSGFVISGQKDAPVPLQNSFSSQIIEYLLNTRLHISNYTDKYDSFHFYVYALADPSPFIHNPKGIFILDRINELGVELRVAVDGKKFAKVDKHQALRMIAELMLDSIPKYLFHRADFDGQKFYGDILPIIKPIADRTRTFQDEEFPI